MGRHLQSQLLLVLLASSLLAARATLRSQEQLENQSEFQIESGLRYVTLPFSWHANSISFRLTVFFRLLLTRILTLVFS